MGAINLNRKLVLEAPEALPDGAGGMVMSWVSVGTVWADVSMRTGREKASSGVAVSSTGFRITVRGVPQGHSARPKPDQRFREGTRVFTITAVSETDPKGRYLTCYAQEEIVA